MPDDIILAGKRGTPSLVTVAIYAKWELETDGGWSKKPGFIKQRLYERYIEPIRALNWHEDTKEKKHGFSIMAVSCLLIETLVSFWRGWETTESYREANGKWHVGKSGKAFKLFFRTQPRFLSFRGTQFYKHVRCGILHQGETTGGWIIGRNGCLFDGNLRINATRFHNQLAFAVMDYMNDLRNPSSGSNLRRNFDKKMKAVIKNCE